MIASFNVHVFHNDRVIIKLGLVRHIRRCMKNVFVVNNILYRLKLQHQVETWYIKINIILSLKLRSCFCRRCCWRSKHDVANAQTIIISYQIYFLQPQAWKIKKKQEILTFTIFRSVNWHLIEVYLHLFRKNERWSQDFVGDILNI